MKAYYFGCWGSVGHYSWNPDRSSAHGSKSGGFYPDDQPWAHIDGRLTPGPRDEDGRLRPYGYKGQQGEAKLHHKDGWTALAMHDYSVDTRPASNAVFLLEGILNFPEAVAAAEEHFPAVVKRIGPITMAEEN